MKTNLQKLQNLHVYQQGLVINELVDALRGLVNRLSDDCNDYPDMAAYRQVQDASDTALRRHRQGHRNGDDDAEAAYFV